MKTVFVTGASGLMGVELCDALLAKGFEVIGVDNTPNTNIDKPNYTFVQAAIDDKDAVTQAMSRGIDVLIHLACTVDNDFPNDLTPAEEKKSAFVDKYLYKAAINAGVNDMILSKAVKSTASAKGIIARICPIYTKSYAPNLHAKIYDPKDGCSYIYGYGDYGYSFCCLYNLIDFIIGILNAAPGINYQGVYNVCDTKPILAKEIVDFERQYHKLGAVVQRNYGADAVKSAMSFGSKIAKTDYRYNDVSIACSNISYDNTKAQRISTFRWKLSNTK